jgi:hypothetical protein
MFPLLGFVWGRVWEADGFRFSGSGKVFDMLNFAVVLVGR